MFMNIPSLPDHWESFALEWEELQELQRELSEEPDEVAMEELKDAAAGRGDVLVWVNETLPVSEEVNDNVKEN